MQAALVDDWLRRQRARHPGRDALSRCQARHRVHDVVAANVGQPATTGVLRSKLLARGASAINSRKFPTVFGTAVMALATLVAAETPSNTIAVAAISVTMFFGFFASGTSWSLATACAPPQYAASLGAIMDFGGFVGGALAPMVTGFVVQESGSFQPALVAAALVGMASAAVYQLLIPNRAIHVSELHLGLAAPPLVPL